MLIVLYILLGLIFLLPFHPVLGLHALSKMDAALSSAFERIVHGAYWISAISGLILVFVKAITVFTRNILGVNFIWLQESGLYLFAAMFLLAGGAIWLIDGHVRVDIFYSRLTPRQKARLDLVGIYAFILPVCALIVYAATPYVARSWATLEGSTAPSGIHAVYLLKTSIPCFAVILAMACYVRARGLLSLLRGEDAAPR